MTLNGSFSWAPEPVNKETINPLKSEYVIRELNGFHRM
jgi:hypothetical protein